MSLSNAFETALLQHILQNANIANVGDATGLQGSATAGNLYLSLHTGDPGEAGDQTTNETAYSGYARVAIVRSGAGWAVAANQGSNVAAVTFPQCVGGAAVITYAAIGTLSSGAGVILISGALPASLSVSAGISPGFAAGAVTFSVD